LFVISVIAKGIKNIIFIMSNRPEVPFKFNSSLQSIITQIKNIAKQNIVQEIEIKKADY
jgi:hypothetical protein